jgi:membrane associated rhomboid family serine protease
MANENNELLELLLRECQAAAPQPWYPADYAQQTGVARDAIDADLDRLRLAGLLRLSDWVQGKGQGYVLTSEGGDVLENPRYLERLRAEGAAPLPAPAPLQPPKTGATTWERGEAVRAALLQPTRPTVTITLIVLNLVVFFYGCLLASQRGLPLNQFVMGGDARIAHDTGAILRPDITSANEWWRLLTCCFVHFGLLHLGVNMYSLYVVGPLLERMWGTWRYLLLYVITGLAGSTAVVIWPKPVPTAGASGALWGLMASMVSWVLLNRRFLPGQLAATWLRQLGFIFLINVAITFGVPNISVAGHFGGGIAGLVVAAPLEFVRYGRGWQRLASALALLAVPVVCIAWIQLSITDQERAQANRIAEQERVEANLHRARKILLEAQDAGRSAYKNHAQPLLEKAGKEMFADAAVVKGALREFDVARQKLKSDQARLKALTFSDPSLSKAVEIGNDYIAAWSAYFDLLSTILARGTPPTKQETDTLEKQLARTQTLTRQLKNSPLFSR